MRKRWFILEEEKEESIVEKILKLEQDEKYRIDLLNEYIKGEFTELEVIDEVKFLLKKGVNLSFSLKKKLSSITLAESLKPRRRREWN